MNIGKFGFDSIHNDPRILADQHHRHSDYDLPLAVLGSESLPNHGSKLHLCNIADEHRRSGWRHADDDTFDIRKARDQAFSSDDGLLLRSLQVSSASIRIVALKSVDDGFESYAIGHQLVVVYLYLIGLEFSALRVHLDNARYCSQFCRDLPVKDAAKFH